MRTPLLLDRPAARNVALWLGLAAVFDLALAPTNLGWPLGGLIVGLPVVGSLLMLVWLVELVRSFAGLPGAPDVTAAVAVAKPGPRSRRSPLAERRV